MRVLTLAEESRVVLEMPTGEDSDTSAVMFPCAHATLKTPKLQISTPRTCDYSDLEKTVDDIEATYTSMNEILQSLKAIVQSTQYAFMSADRLLHHKIAQVYQNLSKTGFQIEQLRSSTARFDKSEERLNAAASNGSTRSLKFEDQVSRRNGRNEDDSAVIEVFFDCVSRFSSSDPDPSTDRLHVNFFGSPEYRFELLPSFYPEQYVSEGSISKAVFAVATLPSPDSEHTFRYFLNYAETARRWQRVVMFATFHGDTQQKDTLRVASSDDHIWAAPKTLPPAVHSLLQNLLPFIEFYPTITQISLQLRLGKSGKITAESPRIEVLEEQSEMSKSDEREFLQYIDSVCCERYVESDIVTYSRINSSSYSVYVGSQACVERKALFASGHKRDNNAFLDYLDEIKHCISLGRCANVSSFKGIVLDDSRRHLRSYLQDLPMLTSVQFLLGLANSRSNTIPWLIRELWARQLIQAIIEIHSQTLIVGVFNLNSVGVRPDGGAVFHRVNRSKNRFEDSYGHVPPELRNQHCKDHLGSAVRDNLNFQTDIFQLGLVLWLLVEHVPKNMGHFCARSACTHRPRSTCMAPHADPVELPKCHDSAPAYLCDIIRGCRLLDPRSRVSTSELACVLRSTPQPEVTSAEIQQVLMPYISSGINFDMTVWCDECGDVTTEIHFHCNICHSGNYDICQACYGKGRRCLVPEHRMVKRATGKNDYIDIS